MNVSEILESIPYLAELPPDLLGEVARTATVVELQPGEVLIEEASHADAMYVVVSGELVVSKSQQSQPIEIARLGPGEIVGEIALLERGLRLATVTASISSMALQIPAKSFDLLLNDPTVARAMFRTVTARLRDTESTVRHGERMAALGKMAAQLMHELNNPAAAVARSARELGRVNVAIEQLSQDLLGVGGIRPASVSEDTSPIERARAEETLDAWLTEQGVEKAFELAPSLVHHGWTSEGLSDLVLDVDPSRRPSFLRLVGLLAASSQLTNEVGIGAGRISELVRIVKEYSFLDRAPVQEIVVTAGIRDTLVLFKPKLAGVEVITRLAEDLAPVLAPGRDLNQVWTNLIDNAADVMKDGGILTIEAFNRDDHIVVTISDTGGGIPPEVAPRIFDPFFTTKEPGAGTGLGLHTVHSIVSKAGGTISVESDSTGATFTVTLPTAQT